MNQYEVLDVYTATSKAGKPYTMFSYVTTDKNGHKRYATELYRGDKAPKAGDILKPRFMKVADQWITVGYDKL